MLLHELGDLTPRSAAVNSTLFERWAASDAPRSVSSDGRAPATHIVYLYDRVLGLTVPVTMPTPDQISGVEKCCCDGCASSSYRTGSCSWLNRLQGKCCDQKPCRLGGLNSEISADGEKIVFISDVDYGGAWTQPAPLMPAGRLHSAHAPLALDSCAVVRHWRCA